MEVAEQTISNTNSQENTEEIKIVELDCTKCTNESLFDISELKDYYLEKIKVKGVTGQLGKNIIIEISGNTLKISYKKFICKRYMKFLGRKFLRLKKLNSFVRLVANTKQGYAFRFYNVEKDNEE